MTKAVKIVLTIVGTLVLVAITMVSSLIAIKDVSGSDFHTPALPVMIAIVVGAIASVIIGALFSKLFIYLSQLGQETKQSVSFMNSWYATVVGMLPVGIINLFLVTVLNVYKNDNKVASVIGNVVATLLYTLILRQEGTITKRTQIIFIVISVVLSAGITFAF
ncbi:MFS transporter [Leuconostoc mesenteroides]